MYKILGLLFLTFQFNITAGIECYDCGYLDILPGSSDQCLETQYGNHTTCVLGLNSNASIFSGNGEFNETGMSPVCYTLQGKFRNQPMFMRGCDVVPQQEAGLCLSNNISVWFDTERGREYVEEHRFCTCKDDFCNDVSDNGIQISPLVQIMFLCNLLVLLNFCDSISN